MESRIAWMRQHLINAATGHDVAAKKDSHHLLLWRPN
jgi:hypothetical protein